MEVLENISMKPYGTFGVEAKARYFATFTEAQELQILLKKYADLPFLILGEGSNMLFTQDFQGIVLCNRIKGISVGKDGVGKVRVGAGENWHEFVLWTLEHGYYGLENLSLIYGSVGASPMQNIGAYGVEVKQYITQVLAYHTETHEIHIFSNADCEFGYRSSVFKTTQKGKYVILYVEFDLPTTPHLHLAYGDIQKTLADMQIDLPTPKDVSQAIIQIRQSKLPNPMEIGNAGSFFKNPEIMLSQYESLKQQYPALPAYPAPKVHEVKVPAGWLIEQAGWKGYRRGDAGVHQKQALVLVNYGKATGKAIWELAQEIQADIEQKFGIQLTPEVNIV